MKVFWGLLIVLAVCAAGVAFWSGEDRRPSVEPGVGVQEELPAAPVIEAKPEPVSDEKTAGKAGEIAAAPAPVSIDAAVDAATGAKPATPQGEPVKAVEVKVEAKPDGKAVEVKPDEKKPAETKGESVQEAKPAADASAEPESGPPPKIEEQADGSRLVDGRYVLKGDGSKEKPYEVTWEMLVSAQETYEPSAGKKKIPGRVMMLDGRYIKLTGYVAFPLAVSQPKELLSMLNQWDGCCIGVPPTPYDAVEVQLLDRVMGENRQATFGVVEGRLTVKPYVVGDWLVGLYLMTDAEFRPTQFGGT